MPRYVLRIWLDDRPGALGSVASRIGSVKGDLVGIEILERGAGRVIDELIVDLPSDEIVDLMVREVQEVDGVDVENVTLEPSPNRDPRLDAILTAASLVEKDNLGEFSRELVDRLAADFMVSWIVVVDISDYSIIVTYGDIPSEGWVRAYLQGLTVGSVHDLTEPSDLALAVMARSNVAVLLGRAERPFRDLERSQLNAIARIGDMRLDLLLRESKLG